MSNFTLVWLTHGTAGVPHQSHFTLANPDVDQRIHAAGIDVTWFHADKNHYQWWRDNRDTITTPYILFFEYDVLCNVTLSVPDDFKGCAAINMIKYPDRPKWLNEVDPTVFPVAYRPFVYRVAPLAVLLADRAALDSLLLEEHAPLWDMEIYCEDRLPTIMAASGIQLSSLAYGASSESWQQPYKPGHYSIFHPVKEPHV